MAKKKAAKKKKTPTKIKKKPRSPKPTVNGTQPNVIILDDPIPGSSDDAGDGQLTLPFIAPTPFILRKAQENLSGAV